jgi:glucose/arabinose dehydrogenase
MREDDRHALRSDGPRPLGSIRMTSRVRRLLVLFAAALLAIVAVLAAVFAWGPVRVSETRVLLDFLLGRGITPPSDATVSERLWVPPGFRVDVYSAEVPLARVIVFTSSGDLLVSRTRNDAVSILDRDRDGDGRADGHRVLLDGLDGPHGLALHEGWLYVAERTRVSRARFDETSGAVTGPLVPVLAGLTADGRHQTKTIGFGPDGWLYLSQGSSCDVCVEEDPRRATIMRMRPDGGEAAIHATGLRNSVGFDWAPWDGALFATDNARDLMGDDFPPDELNRIEQDRFYGWPHVHGDGVPDPQYGAELSGDTRPTSPVHGFRPHNAPLGIHFLRTTDMPSGHERSALVALHGSWNRSTPDGYKVVALRWNSGGAISESDLLTGFLSPDGIIGRPAFITEGPDGAIYVSDDYAGVIYRVSATTP